MKIEYVSHWDKLYLTPAVSVVLDPMFVGYKYLSISWLKGSIEISWGRINRSNWKQEK